MKGLHPNQKKLLDYLLEHKDGATVDELSAHLEITKTAVKEHLIKVETMGFITFVDIKGPIGRPRRRYLLSEEGHDAYPKQYSWLSNVLLEHLADEFGQQAMTQVMTDLADRVANSLSDKFKGAESTGELLERIEGVLNDLGYRAAVKQKDVRKGAVLEATNCVYHSIALKHPELCQFDIRFIENASKMSVKLEKCISRGDSVCRFCLRKKG